MQTQFNPTVTLNGDFMDNVSKSPAMIGLAVLIINLGGRYLATDISRYDEKVLNNKIMKKLTIFSIAFLSTRDIRYSVLIVFLYSILFSPCGLAYKIVKKTTSALLPFSFFRSLPSDEDTSYMGVHIQNPNPNPNQKHKIKIKIM